METSPQAPPVRRGEINRIGMAASSDLVQLMKRIDERIDILREYIINANDMDKSLNPKEAAAFLKTSTTSIARYRKLGLKYYSIKGHGYTYTRRYLIEFRENYLINPSIASAISTLEMKGRKG